MRVLFAALLLFFVAANAALLAVRNPGYVLLVREPYVIETSLAVFLLLLTAAFACLYLFARLASRLLHAPRELKRWRQARRSRRSREAFLAGLAQLLRGDNAQAEKSLLVAQHNADAPMLVSLASAIAAQGRQQPDKRDRHLADAHRLAESDALAADLVQARLLIESGQLDAAHGLLNRLVGTPPAPAEAVRLLLQVNRQMEDWQALAQWLPEARRHHLLPVEQIDMLETEAHRELLSLDLPVGLLETLHKAWEAVPTALRQHPAVLAAYARQLLRQNAPDECATLLADALDRRWDESLATLYSEAAVSKPAVQLEVAEEWHTRHGESAGLLLALGRIARRCQLP
ncbi:MAG: hypothetical protein OEV31_06050, partial [Gammaproteobacteria bacterium]|nr:hypothetical protein [Gammaproteobacteria bacterium]